MLILLPPSEGKTPARSGSRPVELAGLSFPELTAAREEVGSALVSTSARTDALAVLGVGASREDDVRANVDLWDEPAAPAARIYSGVLFDALDVAGMDAAARRRAARSLLVISALWGAIRLTDRIPAYRLSMPVALPGVGPLATYWRPHLDAVLTSAVRRGVVVDCRSAPYQKAWPTSVPQRTATIRVVGGDSRTAVSHMAKHTRGLVARHLCTRGGSAPRTPEQLAAAVGEAFEVGLSAPAGARATWTVDVVQR